MADLSQPGDIAIAKLKDSDDLLIISGDRHRSVRVPCHGVAALIGKTRNELKMGDARTVAPELLRAPSLAFGRIETCEELYDSDRNETAGHTGTETSLSDPYGLDQPYGEHADDWKNDLGGSGKE